MAAPLNNQTMQALWDAIPHEPMVMRVPPELIPFLILNERGEFAGFTDEARPILDRRRDELIARCRAGTAPLSHLFATEE